MLICYLREFYTLPRNMARYSVACLSTYFAVYIHSVYVISVLVYCKCKVIVVISLVNFLELIYVFFILQLEGKELQTQIHKEIISYRKIISAKKKAAEEKNSQKAAALKDVSQSAAALTDVSQSAAVHKDVSHSAEALKDVTQGAVALKDVPQSAAALKDVPQSTAALLDKPKSTAALKDVPKSAAVLKDAPQSEAAVKDAPQSAVALKAVPQTSEALKDVPQTAAAVKDVSKKPATESKSDQMDVTPPKVQSIQDSMIIPNFQDRIKSIIATALKDTGSDEAKHTRKTPSLAYLMNKQKQTPRSLTSILKNSSSRQISTTTKLAGSEKAERVKPLSVSIRDPRDIKTIKSSFKQVELSDPEISSSLNRAAYSPISPTRSPPSPLFHANNRSKVVMDGYSVNNNVRPQNYHSKSRSSDSSSLIPETILTNQNSKNPALTDPRNKDGSKVAKISPYTHMMDQSRSKKSIEELKAKNGFSLGSKPHSHSYQHRDEQYERKMKSKYQTSSDVPKDRRKERPESSKVHYAQAKKDHLHPYYKLDKEIAHKLELKRSHSKHSLPSSGKSKHYFSV